VLPGVRRDASAIVGDALRVAIGDLKGDGHAEIVLAGPTTLRVSTMEGKELARADAPGGIELLDVADIDGDKRAEILAGFGRTPARRDGSARLSVFRLAGGKLVEEIVLEPKTTRLDVVALLPMALTPPALRYATFLDKYQVEIGVARRQAKDWKTEPGAQIAMVTALGQGDVDGDRKAELVVSRLYGDAPGSDGGAFVLADDGKRTSIPTTRGVRALAVADTDGDGRAEVFLADGWHRDYGHQAQGLLTWARFRDGAFVSEVIEDTPGQYALDKLVPADVDGDGHVEIIALGSAYVRVFHREGERWHGLTIAGPCRDVAVTKVDGQRGAELLLVGPHSEWVGLSGVPFE